MSSQSLGLVLDRRISRSDGSFLPKTRSSGHGSSKAAREPRSLDHRSCNLSTRESAKDTFFGLGIIWIILLFKQA